MLSDYELALWGEYPLDFGQALSADERTRLKEAKRTKLFDLFTLSQKFDDSISTNELERQLSPFELTLLDDIQPNLSTQIAQKAQKGKSEICMKDLVRHGEFNSFPFVLHTGDGTNTGHYQLAIVSSAEEAKSLCVINNTQPPAGYTPQETADFIRDQNLILQRLAREIIFPYFRLSFLQGCLLFLEAGQFDSAFFWRIF